MANCHNLFEDFHSTISIDKSKKEFLISAREGIQEKITNYFKNDLKQKVPDYKIQGSFPMATIVNPLDEEYDIDIGVHLQNLDSDKKNWPTPETVHNWIYKAVEKHTKEKPTDKRTCVRVNYSGNYHADLPIYSFHKNEPYLAEKGDAGWHPSDAKAFVDWFKGKVKDKGQQVRRLVKYLKAWADNQSKSGNLPSGFVLTILIVEEYEKAEREDVSFSATVKNINNRIKKSENFLNPVDEDENLRYRISDAQMRNFKKRLSSLVGSASSALKEESKKEACKKWRKEFGDKFSSCENIEDSESALTTSAPALLRDDARSA